MSVCMCEYLLLPVVPWGVKPPPTHQLLARQTCASQASLPERWGPVVLSKTGMLWGTWAVSQSLEAFNLKELRIDGVLMC
jgi:hypothetical protein